MEEFRKLRDIALPVSQRDRNLTTFPLESPAGKESTANGLSTVLTHTTTPLEENTEDCTFPCFAQQLFSLNDKGLNNVLEDIDAQYKVNIHDPKTKEVVTATETLVTAILHAAADIDPRFKSSCIYSGSFYDDLKVGQADEFDFVARIDSLSQKGVLEAKISKRKRGFVYLVAKDKTVQDQFKDFLTEPDGDPCLESTDKILSVDAFQEYFIELISSAIRCIDIPDNFIPVDKLEECEVNKDSWRPHNHGPCATLYLTYLCESTSDVVSIDIDIAPSVAYPGGEYKPPVIDVLSATQPSNQFLRLVRDICNTSEVMLVPFRFDYTEKRGERAWHYHYSDTWRVSHSSIEKAVFSLFKPDDTEKKLCRILKIVKEIYLQGTNEITNKSNSRPLKFLEPPSTCLTSCTVEQITGFSSESENETDTDTDDGDDEDFGGDREDFGEDREDFGGDREDSESVSDFSAEINRMESQAEYEYDDAGDETSQSLKACYSQNSAVSNQNDNKSDCLDGSRYSHNNDTLHNAYQIEIIYSRVQEAPSRKPFSSYTAIQRELSGKVTNGNNTVAFLDGSESIINDHSSQSEQGVLEELYTGNTPAFDSSKSDPVDESLDNARQVELCGKPGEVPMALQDTDFQQTINLSYRDSKPLLKTYMIKMLFLAMKTAYPETERWKSDQLAPLLKQALCMIYYAYSSQEKGILNFWFQDLIENRTRDSTCKEVLFCLKRLVQILEDKIQSCHSF